MMARSSIALGFVLFLGIATAFQFSSLQLDIVEVEHITPRVPEGWELVGPTSPNQELTILIAVKLQNLHTLHEFSASVSTPHSKNYGKYKTAGELSEMIKPKDESFEVLKLWFETTSPNIKSKLVGGGRWLEVTASAEVISKLLFIPTFNNYRHISTPSEVISRSIENYKVPKVVADHIDFIANVIRFPTRLRVKNFGSELLTLQSPESIQMLYNISIPDDANNLQAVVSFLGQYFSPSDLSEFQNNFGLPPTPIESVYGYNDASKPGVEASLDVQYLQGITNCSIETWVFSTNGSTPSGNEPFLTWLISLADYATIPWVNSMSYQDYEYTVSEQYAIRVCNEFELYTAMGITFVTGSGDWGVGCNVEEGGQCNYFTADFPSSCPVVVSSGATRVNEKGDQGGVGFSSGGFSNYFAQPTYQSQVVKSYLSNNESGLIPPQSFFNATGRAFPDIAAIGVDFEVYVDHVPMPVSGTSAATPTIASMLSMINSLRILASLPTLGNPLPFLYSAYSNPLAYTDVVSGEVQDQGCCGYSFSAVTGWDPVGGLGTPNFYVLSEMALDSSLFHFN